MRDEIVVALAYEWRRAENKFIDSGDDGLKWEARKHQKEAGLTEKEKLALEELCTSFGV